MINTVRFGTGWRPNVTTKVINGTDKATEAIQHDNQDVKIFTGGSGMEGKIGMAAVLYQNGLRHLTKSHHQLGSQRHHTVYEGEGIGAMLGTKLISK